jgi:catechol 2,3-dioxygenase-like lactoylglutathione lyase family enzyme
MTVHLDHFLVPIRDRVASAKFLAGLLGVTWAESGVGPFSPVYVNDGLTLDFDEAEGEFPIQHYCFRVTQPEFDEILGRIKSAGIAFRSLPHGPDDFTINHDHGGSIVYWSKPEGHIWELLTVSYDRQKK